MSFLGVFDPFWSPDSARFAWGAQAGYNYQLGNFVLGIEGDCQWVAGKTSTTFTAADRRCCRQFATSDLKWMATIRGRVGLAFSQVLVYGTGGVAFAHFSDDWGLAVLGANEFSKARPKPDGLPAAASNTCSPATGPPKSKAFMLISEAQF